MDSAYRSYYDHRPASYQARLPPLKYSTPHELRGAPRRHRDGEPASLTSEMGACVRPIYPADYTESCYMEALQEEISGVLDRMESLHKIEGVAALSYLPPTPVDFPHSTSRESNSIIRCPEPIIHLSTPFTPLPNICFATPSSLEAKAIIQERRPFPDEFHSYLSEIFFESNVTGLDLEGEGEDGVETTLRMPSGNNGKQEHLFSGHTSLLAQGIFNDTVIPSSSSQEMMPQIIRRHSLATMDATVYEQSSSGASNPFSRSYDTQGDPFAPSYVLARERAKLYKHASISSARRTSEPLVRASCKLEDIKPKSKPVKETTLEPSLPVKAKEGYRSLTASLGVTSFDEMKSNNSPSIDSERKHFLSSNVYKLNPVTQSLGRGKALPLLTPRRPVPDKVQLPTPTTTPKISLKLGKRAGHVKSTPKTAGVSEGKAMERDAKALYPTPPSCPASPFSMSGASRLKKASISAPTPTPLFESPTINKGKKRKRRLSSKLKAMEIGEDESDGNFASHKSKKLRTLKNTRHSEDVEVFKYTKEEDNIILSHWDGCPPLPANILSTIQKDLVSRGFVARSLPALKFRVYNSLREQFEEKRLQMDRKRTKQESRRSRESRNSSRP